MADPVTWMAVISMVSTAASGAVSYVGAQRNAKAQDYAADAAEAQGPQRKRLVIKFHKSALEGFVVGW